MRKKLLSLILILSFVLSNSITANAEYMSSDNISGLEIAQTVYLDKEFTVPAASYEVDNRGRKHYNYENTYYKLDIGSNKLAIVEIVSDDLTKDDDFRYDYKIERLYKGKLIEADTIPRPYFDPRNSKKIYILDKNTEYYIYCENKETDIKITLHNKTSESTKLSKTNKGTITEGFEKLYKFKTSSKQNASLMNLKYAGEGATLDYYVIGLDSKGNAFVDRPLYGWVINKVSYYPRTYKKNTEHYVYLEIENYTVPTDYTFTFLSGPKQKTVKKAKFKKKYSGNTFWTADYYNFKIKPNHKAKLKVEIKGKNIEVVFNGREKIKCKKKITKTIWVDATGGGLFGDSKDIYVQVYQKGKKPGDYNLKGQDYTIKITKLKEKKWGT